MTQNKLLKAIVVYGPALALETVTGLDRWTAVWVSGAVCIFYTSIGGLKAVVWTDTLQILLMFAGFLSIIVDGALNFGGFSEIIRRADEGGRLIWNDFSGDVTRRHSFWSIVFGGTFGVWGAFFCVTQSYTQRMMACRSRRDMRIAVYGGYLGIAIILIFAMLTGFVAYASYQCCDPINAGWISSRDQLIPYLAIDRLRNTPGAASLFVIGKSYREIVSLKRNRITVEIKAHMVALFLQCRLESIQWQLFSFLISSNRTKIESNFLILLKKIIRF